MSDLKPAYLVEGDDAAQIDDWRGRFRKRAAAEGEAGSLEVLASEAATPLAVAEALSALTLAVGRRYVLADGVQGWKEKEVAPIAAALGALAPETVVMFLAEGPFKKGASQAPAALAKAVEKAGGEVRVCRAPKRSGYRAWVQKRGKALGLDLSDEAAEALVRLIGEDEGRRLRELRILRELEKLACFAPRDGKVALETVEELTAADAEARAYEVADAFVQGQPARAMGLAEDMLDRAGGPTDVMMHLLYALRRASSQARQAWAAVEQGVPTRQLASLLRVQPFIASRIAEQAGNADPERLERLVARLAALDWDVRGGSDRDGVTALTLALAGEGLEARAG